MPRVQAYGGPRVETKPLPTVRHSLAESAAAVAAAGLQDIGQQISTFAYRQGMVMATAERQRADETAVLGANNQLASWLNKRMYDPQNGAMTVKGKDAAGILDTVSHEFQDQVDSINGSLASEAQRAEFNKFAMNRSLTAEHEMRTYIYREMQDYDKNETAASIANQNDFAAQNATSPGFVQHALEQNVATAMAYARRQGLGDEDRQHLLLDTQTATHNAVLDSLLAQGHDQEAEVYFKDVKAAKQLNAAALQKFGEKIDTATTQGAGFRAANDIWERLGPKPGDDETAIDIAAMETEAREQFKEEPKKYEATVRYLRERQQGVNSSRNERDAAIVGGLYKMVAGGKGLTEVTRSAEYQHASGKVQLDVSNAIISRAAQQESRAYTAESRAYQREERARREREYAGAYMALQYDKPEILAQMSESQIWATYPQVGEQSALRLIEHKREYANNPTAAAAAKIDTDDFNQLADKAGFPVYVSTKTDTDKKQIGQLSVDVQDALDAHPRSAKNPLTRDERRTIMQQVIDRRVMVNDWGGDSPMSASQVVNESDQANAYVPIQNIPASSLSKSINYLRSNNAAYQRLSDDEIKKRAKDAIQRAYGATVLGLGRAEEAKRLGEAK